MPKQQLSLRMIKDLLRLKWHAKLSHEQVAATLKISKGVVAKYLRLATAAGLDWDTVQAWSEQQLSTALQPRSLASLPVIVPDWGRVHRELDRKGVTLMLLWQEYVEATCMTSLLSATSKQQRSSPATSTTTNGTRRSRQTGCSPRRRWTGCGTTPTAWSLTGEATAIRRCRRHRKKEAQKGPKTQQNRPRKRVV
jgi:hypothetical protein